MKRNTIALYLGPKGSGKSHLLKRHIEPLQRFVVWDPMDEYSAPDRLVPYSGARRWTSLDAFGAQLRAQRGYGREAFTDLDDDQLARFLRMGFELVGGVVVVEEVGTAVEDAEARRALRRLLQRGRHRSIDVLLASPRPRGIPQDVVQQADKAFAFRTAHPGDLEFFDKMAGHKASEKLRVLPEHVPLELSP